MKLKRINIDDCVVGNEYYVQIGIWQGNVSFVGSYLKGRRKFYRFTFGPADNWVNQFNFKGPKSKYKVFISGGVSNEIK